MAMLENGLPDPQSDPAPLFAAVMNAAIETGAAFVRKGIEKIQEAPAAIGDAMAKASSAVRGGFEGLRPSSGLEDHSPDQARSRQPEVAIEAPAIPEHAKAAAMSVAKAEEIKGPSTEVANDVSVSPVAVAAAKTQSMGLGV